MRTLNPLKADGLPGPAARVGSAAGLRNPLALPSLSLTPCRCVCRTGSERESSSPSLVAPVWAGFPSTHLTPAHPAGQAPRPQDSVGCSSSHSRPLPLALSEVLKPGSMGSRWDAGHLLPARRGLHGGRAGGSQPCMAHLSFRAVRWDPVVGSFNCCLRNVASQNHLPGSHPLHLPATLPWGWCGLAVSGGTLTHPRVTAVPCP